MMQNDKASYYSLMKEIKENKTTISRWKSGPEPTWGPALANYVKTTEKGTFGGFKIKLGNRQELAKECSEHIERLFKELDRRFAPSPIQENLTMLFDPGYLYEHWKDIDTPAYGRSALDFLQNKYENLVGFDASAVQAEWESIKTALGDFMDISSSADQKENFWQKFLLWKQSTTPEFLTRTKNLLILLGVYLISPTNSAECERGVSYQRISDTAFSKSII